MIETLFSMIAEFKSRIYTPCRRAWIRHRREDRFPQRAEDVRTHPWEKLNFKSSDFLPVKNQRGKKKKKCSYVSVLIYAKAKTLSS